MNASRIARAALIGGLLAAVLDITGAIVLSAFRGVDAIQVLQSVASGFLGREAYRGGAATALLGAATHLGIATTMATAYMLVASRQPRLTRRPWLWGPIFGLLMWMIMYLVVLPLRWPDHFPRFKLEATAGQLFCHLFLVGLPISFVASRLLSSREHAR